MSREELEALGWRFTVRVRKDGKVGVLAVATEPDGGETEIWRGYFGSEDAALAALLPDVTAMEGIRSKWDVAV